MDDVDVPRKIHQAVSDKDMKVVKLLLEKAKNPSELLNYENKSGFTVLMMAVQLLPEDDAHLFTNYILERKPLNIDKINKMGQTALMLCAKKNYIRVIKLLLKYNANYDIRSQEGKTAMEIATKEEAKVPFLEKMDQRAAEAKQALMIKQARSLIKFVTNNSAEGVEPILTQYKEKFPEILLWSESPADLTAVEVAFENQNLNIMRILLEAGTPLNELPKRNNMTLIQRMFIQPRMASYPNTAASREREEMRMAMVQILLEFNINVLGVADADGRNLLFTVLDKGWHEYIPHLVEAGLSCNSREMSNYLYRGSAAYRKLRGDTALIYATRKNNHESVRALLGMKGIDVNAAGFSGMTAVMWAAYNNNVPAMEALLEKGGDLNAVDEEGHTAFLFSIDRLNFDMMYYLVRQPKCNVSLGNTLNGTTPLMMCTRKLVGLPKKYQTLPYEPLDDASVKLNTDISTFIKELVGVRKAVIGVETKHGFSAYYWAKLKKQPDLMIYFKIQEANQEIERKVMQELADSGFEMPS